MKLVLCFLSVALFTLVNLGDLSAEDSDFAYPPTISLDEVRQRVDACSAAHPRLFVTQAGLGKLRRTSEQDALGRLLAKAVVAQADAILDLEPITRKLQGRRLLGESRRCVKRTVTLSVAYHLTGDERYARRCEAEMLAAARFRDWNPSHFLDVAEMTFALAIGYDWLFDQLDETHRDEIRSAIVQKGVVLPFETRHKGWVKSHNNWGQVCHGGLTAGALAVMEHEPELAAKTVHSAVHNVTYSMAAYAPRGSYPEGPGYWSYGTSYNVLLVGVLESVLGTDFGLSKAPGFDQTGQYVNLACGPSGLFFNYADGGSGRSPQAALLWLAARFDRPDWLLGEKEIWQRSLANLDARHARASGGRLVPLALLWLDGANREADIQMPLHWHSEGETPITVHRSSWTDPDATYVGLKAGSPSANHGQMDIGSFVLDMDGHRWALDLGAESYHGIESRGMNLWSRNQDSDRWTIFRQSNHGHNTLVIDGRLQKASAKGTVVEFSDDVEFPHSVVDMSAVYDGQAASVRRGVALLPSREVLIQDELTGLEPGSRVRWGMITPGTPGRLEGTEVALRNDDTRVTMSLLSPQSSEWRVIDTEKPRNEWDSPNRGTRMVAFETVAPESGEVKIAVLATPGSCAKSVKNDLKLDSLDEWSRRIAR